MPVTKPTELPRWATGIAVMTEPSASVKDTGFVPGTPADAAHTNWLLNRLYLWMQYLDDPASMAVGGLTVNAGGSITTPAISTTTLTAAGNATVAGTLAVTGAFTASGGITVPVGQTATLQGNATVGGTLGVTGNATVGGTLGATGRITASAGLTVAVGQTATLQGNTTVGGTLGVTGNTSVGGSLAVTGAATVGSTLGVTGAATVGSLTAAANQHVTVSGTGDYKHGDRIMQLPASVGTPVNVSDGMSGYPATSATGWKYARSIGILAQFWYGPVSGQEVVFPITLMVGNRIKAVSARIQDTSGAGNTITMYLHKSAPTSSFLSGSAQVGATQTSAANGTVQTLTLSGLTQTINSFEMYNVSLRANGSSFTNHRILGVQVTFDRP